MRDWFDVVADFTLIVLLNIVLIVSCEGCIFVWDGFAADNGRNTVHKLLVAQENVDEALDWLEFRDFLINKDVGRDFAQVYVISVCHVFVSVCFFIETVFAKSFIFLCCDT